MMKIVWGDGFKSPEIYQTGAFVRKHLPSTSFVAVMIVNKLDYFYKHD